MSNDQLVPKMMSNLRRSLRQFNELRKVECELDYIPSAEGSCLIKFGNTHVICTASFDNQVPHFLRNTGQGWITAEYSMLPRSTDRRMQREASKGKLDGRTQEIQRLIGRSLRAAADLKKLGERQIIVDCDVIRADGGTRTASITGGYIALHMALQKLYDKKIIHKFPINSQVAAISCGIVNGSTLLDLEYVEDSDAEVDANFVMSGDRNLIEIQISGEKRAFSSQEYTSLYNVALEGIDQLLAFQRKILGI